MATAPDFVLLIFDDLLFFKQHNPKIFNLGGDKKNEKLQNEPKS